MNTIKLSGITKHGKQQIKQFGHTWIVKERQPAKWLLQSMCGQDLRWLDWPDKDFEVQAIISSQSVQT